MSPNNHVGKDVDAVAFVNQLDMSSEFLIGGKFVVLTQSGSMYTIDTEAETIAKNSEEPLSGKVIGATFGGSMIMMGRLLKGSLMEFVWNGEVYHSSPIVGIEVAE